MRRRALTDLWPLFGLELSTPRLMLSPVADSDLVELLEVIHGGLHLPDRMPFDTPWTQVEPEALVPNTLRYLWQSRSATHPTNWQLMFAVRADGAMIGLQELSGSSFAVRRTVETGSYLGLSRQGRGLGSEMRSAVLLFAFDHLGATRAESGAFLDNPSSQRVSVKLGYQPNGSRVKERRPGEAVVSQQFLLTPETFCRPPWELKVAGFPACRALLGI